MISIWMKRMLQLKGRPASNGSDYLGLYFAREDLDKIAKLDAGHKGNTGDWDPWEHE